MEKRSTKLDAVKKRFEDAADSLTSLQKQLLAASQHAMFPQDGPNDPQILLNLVQAFCRSHPRLLDKINSVYQTLVDSTVKINEQYITGSVHGYTKE